MDGCLTAKLQPELAVMAAHMAIEATSRIGGDLPRCIGKEKHRDGLGFSTKMATKGATERAKSFIA